MLRPRVILFVYILVYSGNPLAASWTVAPALSVSENYIDNIDLTAKDQERSSYVTELVPGLLVTGQARRSKIKFDYYAQGLAYSEDSDLNSVNHNLDSSAFLSLVPEAFDLNLSAGVSQQIIDPEGQIGFDNFTSLDNQGDVETFEISPVLKKRFSKTTSGYLQYVHRIVNYEDDNQSDNKTESYNLNVEGVLVANQLTWNLEAKNENVAYDDERNDEELTQADIKLTYIQSTRWSFTGSAGYEKYVLNSALVEDESESDTWDFGFSWSPISRSNISASYGERIFGKTQTLKISHRTRRLNVLVSWEESFDSKNFQQFDSDEEVNAPSSQSELSLPSSDEVFVGEKFSFNIGFNTAKTGISAAISEENRTFRTDQEDENTKAGNVYFSYKPGGRTLLSASAGQTVTEFASGNEDTLVDFSIAVDRTIGARSSGKFEFSRVLRDSDFLRYDANKISVQYSIKF